MNELSPDERERRVANLRNLVIEWDPRRLADRAPGWYDALVLDLWTFLAAGPSRADIGAYLWHEVQERYTPFPDAKQVEAIAAEIADRVAMWDTHQTAGSEIERASYEVLSGADEDPHPKAMWAFELPASQPAKFRNGSLADLPEEHEGFQEYEASADPDRVREESAQRRFRGQYFRRTRRLRERDRHAE